MDDSRRRQDAGNARPPRPKPSITGIVPNPKSAIDPIPAHTPPAVAASAAAAYTNPQGNRPLTIPRTSNEPIVRRLRLHPSHPLIRSVHRPIHAAGRAQAVATRPESRSNPAVNDTHRCTPTMDKPCPSAPEAKPISM